MKKIKIDPMLNEYQAETVRAAFLNTILPEHPTVAQAAGASRRANSFVKFIQMSLIQNSVFATYTWGPEATYPFAPKTKTKVKAKNHARK